VTTETRWAISGLQPWWWAIVMGYKPIENRRSESSVTHACKRFRGPVLLHASAGVGRNSEDFDAACDFVGSRVPREAWEAFAKVSVTTKLVPAGHGRKVARSSPTDALLRGGIIGQAEVVGIIDPEGQPYGMGSQAAIAAFGDRWDLVRETWHMPGQWGILIRNARRLPFVPCKGALGLWRYKEAS